MRTLARISFVALLIAGWLTPSPAAGQARSGPVYRVPVTGTVEMGLAPFIERALAEAEAADAQAVILDIDTPGGRVDAAERIADALHDARVPTYAFVNRRALSAGAMIALATDGIYMRPGSSLGAATPVTGEGQTASEKIVSAMRAQFRALAEARGLDPQVAAAMVDPAVEVPGLDGPETLLTLSTGDAVRIGYASEVEGWDALLARLGIRPTEVVESRTNWAERVVRFLSDPMVAPFLLSLGFMGLLIELKTPSFGLAGAAGALSLAGFFGSHLVLGLAGWESVVLVGLGIVLLLVELFLLPGFGVAGLAGIAAIVGSVVLTLVGATPTSGDFAVAGGVLLSTLALTGFMIWALLRRLPHDRRMSRLVFGGDTGRARGYLAGEVRADLEGIEGVTVTDLRPAGTARFGEERLDVVSESGWIAAGTPVRLVRSEGYRHVVGLAPAEE